jgi:hypothetical protein
MRPFQYGVLRHCTAKHRYSELHVRAFNGLREAYNILHPTHNTGKELEQAIIPTSLIIMPWRKPDGPLFHHVLHLQIDVNFLHPVLEYIYQHTENHPEHLLEGLYIFSKKRQNFKILKGYARCN